MPGPARGPGMGRRGGPGGPHMGGRCGPGMGPRPSTPSAATVWQLISEALSPRRVSWMTMLMIPAVLLVAILVLLLL